MVQPVPILMYHKVGHPVTDSNDTFLNVSEQDFRRQMRALSRLGYQARPFCEVVEAAAQGRALPRRTFAVTFDDGYVNVGRIAAPILAEYAFPATVFVVSGRVGAFNDWDGERGKPVLPLMGWDALCGLMATGWEMGGHTRTHPLLGLLDEAEAQAEICAGKEEAEAQLGCELRTFCYPFGHLNARTPTLVRNAGFIGACSTRSGQAGREADPFLLPRVKVSYSDGVFGLFFRLWARPYLPDLRPLRARKLASPPCLEPSPARGRSRAL